MTTIIAHCGIQHHCQIQLFLNTNLLYPPMSHPLTELLQLLHLFVVLLQQLLPRCPQESMYQEVKTVKSLIL